MSTEQTVKVYELAKELGVNSISLVDKLKSLNINVKNHMSDLSLQEAQLARHTLDTSAAKRAAEATQKKTVTKSRKKAPSPGDTATAPAGATAAGPAMNAAEAAAAAASLASKSSPIIRRRVKADGATETVAMSPQIAKTAAQDMEFKGPASADEALAEPSQEQIQEAEAQTFEAEEEPVSEPEAPVAAKPASPLTPPKPVSTSPIRPIGSPPIPAATPSFSPRRSILKIVQPDAPISRPVIKPAPSTSPIRPAGLRGGTSTQDKDGFRIIKMTKENLDQMAEEEAAKKRGGGREAEIRPEDVRFADYRKKEMVFLPKKKRIPVGKQTKRTEITHMKAEKRVVEMKETISVGDLASQLSVKSGDVIRKLMAMGQMATINQSLDFDTATLLANEYQYEVKNIAFKENTVLGTDAIQDAPETLIHRPPVVTIMGHVDHGKTTLLDSIRSANVAGGEAGGITQHIGAYSVDNHGKLITFIDTPGHEAFTVMRARGANVTDIVVLVVSADDGVMPQTREALSHAQAAKVPIIVAMNKIDKPGANPEKIKQGLAELNLLAEDWGGETMFVPVSALKKTNIDKLLDAILLQAEVLDLKANPETLASGTVLEAKLEKGRGPVVSILINRGTLRVGDAIVSGQFAGRVKAMMNDQGATVQSVGPGRAAEVLGFEGLPNGGDKFYSTKTEADARDVAQHRVDQARAKISGASKVSLEDLFSKIQAGEAKELNVILKGDVFGSVEAVRDSLIKLSTEKVKVKPILAAPGGITESDVLLATASGAIIIGFNVRPETKARQLAANEHVEIKTYTVIYELIDDVKKAMAGLLDKKKVERFLGRAEVRQTFSVPKIGTIAGSSVIDGKLLRGANVRLLRDSRIIFEGKMSSLRRFKDDAKEVAQGFECGIGLENYNDLKAGDIIEAFQIDLVAPTLEQV